MTVLTLVNMGFHGIRLIHNTAQAMGTLKRRRRQLVSKWLGPPTAYAPADYEESSDDPPDEFPEDDYPSVKAFGVDVPKVNPPDEPAPMNIDNLILPIVIHDEITEFPKPPPPKPEIPEPVEEEVIMAPVIELPELDLEVPKIVGFIEVPVP